MLWQQGRVLLDSDWNEQIAIVSRWLRLLALDTFGTVGVPLTTPNAFRIGLTDGGAANLSIGAGRLYVNGWPVEHFAGENFTYLNQPFLPSPPPLPNEGNAVVYLDVWQREVTSIEDPSLLNQALGGADTTIRSQTVWQVKIEKCADAEYGTEVGAPPSSGRLWSEVETQASDNPDDVSSPSGFLGTENRLYRVEIHAGGPLGSARFKWSRSNGSIVAGVTGLQVSGSRTTLDVARFESDVMRAFRIGDWVSVTDDHRELHDEPAEMAQIVGAEENNRRIILDRARPSAGARVFGATAAELAQRHTRVQRWDQTAASNVIDGDGLIATGAATIDLEDGIRIRFAADPPDGSFHNGDYWLFAASTADASIETLDGAPPCGPCHHYVPLATLIGLCETDPLVRDCRPAAGTASPVA